MRGKVRLAFRCSNRSSVNVHIDGSTDGAWRLVGVAWTQYLACNPQKVTDTASRLIAHETQALQDGAVDLQPAWGA